MKRISQEAVGALGSMEVEGSAARFTTGQLDRNLYVECNKVLEALGGKWNKKAKAHLFPGDPRDALDQVVLTGKWTDAKQEFGFFETPEKLAEELAEELQLGEGMSVLEPSAGRGRLAKAIDRLGIPCKLFMVEMDPKNVTALVGMGYGRDGIYQADFLTLWTVPSSAKSFDRILMNPPFSRQQDIDHVLHAWDLLKTGGRLVAVMSGSTRTRQNKKTKAFRELVQKHGHMSVLPPESFKASGTSIDTVYVVLDK